MNQFHISPQFGSARQAYIHALAANKASIEVGREARIEVLKNHVFVVGQDWKEEHGERILDPIKDYLMSDEDFESYCKLAHAERSKRGLILPYWNSTDDALTLEPLMKAEKDFLEEIFKSVPQKYADDLRRGSNLASHKKRILELGLKLNLGGDEQ